MASPTLPSIEVDAAEKLQGEENDSKSSNQEDKRKSSQSQPQRASQGGNADSSNRGTSGGQRKSQLNATQNNAKKSSFLKSGDYLVPQRVMDELYAQVEEAEKLKSKKKSSKGSDEETKRKLAEEEQRQLGKKFSVPNVEGAIPKETLRKLSNRTIRQLILHAKKEIERFETENFLFERTIEKLEKPEKAIEDLHPGVEDEVNQNMRDTGPQICPSDSEEEPEDTGEYVPIIPINEIHLSTDSFFDAMSDNSKEAALNYFENIGEIAPSNFDVIRFKYGAYVKGSEEDAAYTAAEGEKTRLDNKVFESRALLDDKTANTANTGSKPIIAPKVLDLNSMYEEIADEDPDYPGFSMTTAKELPTEDKLKFALEEEEEFRHQFYKYETLALREEGAVQVHIDAHKHSIRLLLTLRKEFRALMKEIRHPVSGKFMAENILRFKRKMRNQISAEETKTRMTIRKIMAIKKRAVHQLKTNKESGNAISQIDFEHLMVENQIFLDEMEEMNLSLKYLKQLSGHFFQILKEDQDSIGRLNQEDQRLSREIDTKRNVMKSFEKTYLKYRTMIYDTNARMDELKRKLSEYHAPKPLEYIRLKACQYEMESDVSNLQKKLDEINLSLITARSTFAMYCKMLPYGDKTDFENETWLDEVKQEVEENNLMSLLDDDDDKDADDLPSAFKSRIKVTASKAQGQTARQRKLARVKTAQTILLAPTRATKTRKSVKPTTYDKDFQYELSTPLAEPSIML